MHIPLLTPLLATLALLATLPAQKVEVGREADRTTTTCVIADEGKPPLAVVAVHYGRAEWRAEYEGVFTPQADGLYTRLGKGWWTTLETLGAIEIAGTRLAPGTYYLGIAVAKDGAFSLLFFDSKKAMTARLLPSTTALYTGEARPDAKASLELVKDTLPNTALLAIELTADAKDPTNGRLAIRWGKHEASAPVKFRFARKQLTARPGQGL